MQEYDYLIVIVGILLVPLITIYVSGFFTNNVMIRGILAFLSIFLLKAIYIGKVIKEEFKDFNTKQSKKIE